MNRKIRKRLQKIKRRIERRLEGRREDLGRPTFSSQGIRVEWADKVRAIGVGGIGLVHQLARHVGLVEAIDRRVHVLKNHRPYHESDHVLNLAYNALCDGVRLEDIELRRNDEVFLDALGTERIPDPTTAGDFCRRFDETHVRSLMEAVDEARLNVWAPQPQAFFDRATLDLDGILVATTGACKEGMDISYKGTWGYHVLIVSLAETGEVLRLVNRPGNRPSQEGAAAEADAAIALCRRGAGVGGPGRQSPEQLGVHGHDRPGVEPQSLVGPVPSRAAPLAPAASGPEAAGPADGVPHVPQRVHQDPVPEPIPKPESGCSGPPQPSTAQTCRREPNVSTNNREPGNDASHVARPTPRRSPLQELPDNHPTVFACLRVSLQHIPRHGQFPSRNEYDVRNGGPKWSATCETLISDLKNRVQDGENPINGPPFYDVR